MRGIMASFPGKEIFQDASDQQTFKNITNNWPVILYGFSPTLCHASIYENIYNICHFFI